MSKNSGPSRLDGIAKQIGLVPSRAFAPPNGATALALRPESAVIIAIMPSRAAISGYDASRPIWLWRYTVAAATFCFFALSIV